MGSQAGAAMDEQERELWRRADAVLDELLDLPAAEREPRLRGLTADETLRTRVRRLLAAHSQPTGPLDQPPPTLALPASALSGQLLGRWRLQEEIGRGGMAVVYRAVAEGGAEGQVAALKVLTLGSLAQLGRERFLHEQQALLRLRHACIAALYDAGVAADGTPWLAMALIEGEPIDRWCRQRNLDIATRIELVLQVCQALDCSHRNLVVHRDIKPSNVLVDNDGHVHVLDFGIARILDTSATRTGTGLRALTPEYAAPEQFAGAPPSTAMDVYGVGALLYKLLADVPPQKSAQGAAIPPSKALRAKAGESPSPEQRERLQQLRGDLDTLVMKALAERPEERYAGVAALADDLQRWLQQRPIRARAPHWRYRLRKFVARNRWQVTAGAAALLLLVAGITGTVWQMRKARVEAARANAMTEESQAQLDYLGSLLEALAPSTEEAREIDRAQLLTEATARARGELGARPRVLASVEMSLGDLAEEIGDYARAAELFDSALARRKQLFGDESAATAEALAASGAARERLKPPQSEEALRRLQAALPVLRRQAPRSEQLLRALGATASALANQDRYPQAQTLLDEGLNLCDDALPMQESCARFWTLAGSYHQRLQQSAQSIAFYERALQARRRLRGPDHADTLAVTSELALAHANAGNLSRGLALLEQVAATQKRIYIRPTQQSLRTLHNLSRLLALSGDSERGLVLSAEYLQQTEELFGPDHPDTALGHAERGGLLFSEARFAEAAAAYAESLRSYRASGGEAGAAIAEGNLADALREQGRAQQALPMQLRSLETVQRVFGGNIARVAGRLSNLARTEAALGRHAQALVHYDRSIDLYQRHVREQGASAANGAYVAAWRARSLLALGRNGEAETELRRSYALIAAEAQPSPRLKGEAFAFLVEAACRNRATDCATLRRQAEAELQRPIPGVAKLRLRAALSATRG